MPQVRKTSPRVDRFLPNRKHNQQGLLELSDGNWTINLPLTRRALCLLSYESTDIVGSCNDVSRLRPTLAHQYSASAWFNITFCGSAKRDLNSHHRFGGPKCYPLNTTGTWSVGICVSPPAPQHTALYCFAALCGTGFAPAMTTPTRNITAYYFTVTAFGLLLIFFWKTTAWKFQEELLKNSINKIIYRKLK